MSGAASARFPGTLAHASPEYPGAALPVASTVQINLLVPMLAQAGNKRHIPCVVAAGSLGSLYEKSPRIRTVRTLSAS